MAHCKQRLHYKMHHNTSEGETFTINPPGRGFFATGKFVLFQCATAGDHLNVMEIKVFAGDTMRCVSHFMSEHDF